MPDPVAEYLRRYGKGGGLQAPPVPTPADPVAAYLQRYGGAPAAGPRRGLESLELSVPEPEVPEVSIQLPLDSTRLPGYEPPVPEQPEPPRMGGIARAMQAQALGQQLATAQRAVRRGFEANLATPPATSPVAAATMPPATVTPPLPEGEPFAVSSGAGRSWGDEGPEQAGVLRRAGDVGISALKGAIGVPEFVVGLADIATLGRAGKLAEKVGFKPDEAKRILDTFYSRQQQEANRSVEEADGLVNTAIAALTHPSVILQTTVESIPSMLGGGAIGRQLVKRGLMPLLAGAAAGEGAVSAGQAAEGVRQQTESGNLSPLQALTTTVSGAVTGLLGVWGGRFAKRLGIEDVDVLVAAGTKSAAAGKSLTRAVLGGAVQEGFLEELPQSVQEQVAQNLALGRPLDEGVDQAAVLGTLAGSVMGAGVNVRSGRAAKQRERVLKDLLGDDVPATVAQVQGLLAEIDAKVKAGAKVEEVVPEVLARFRAAQQAQPEAGAPTEPPAPPPAAPPAAPESPVAATEAEVATPATPAPPAQPEANVVAPAPAEPHPAVAWRERIEALAGREEADALRDEIIADQHPRMTDDVKRMLGVEIGIKLQKLGGNLTGREQETPAYGAVRDAALEAVASGTGAVRSRDAYMMGGYAGIEGRSLEEAWQKWTEDRQNRVPKNYKSEAALQKWQDMITSHRPIFEAGYAKGVEEKAKEAPAAPAPEPTLAEALQVVPLPEEAAPVPETAPVAAPAPAPEPEAAPAAIDYLNMTPEDEAEYNTLYDEVAATIQPPKLKWKRLQDGTHEAEFEGETITLTKDGEGEDAYWEADNGDPNQYPTLKEAKEGVAEALVDVVATKETERRFAERRKAPVPAPVAEVAPAPAPAAAPPAATQAPPRKPATAPHRKPTKKEEVVLGHILPKGKNALVSDPVALAAYFTPGQIVEGYGGGRDRVIAYSPTAGVTVQAVDEQGVAIKGERPRQHRTMPTRAEWERVMSARGAEALRAAGRPLPTPEDAAEIANAMYARPGVTDSERRNQFLRGYGDAVAGKVEERQAAKAGTPYAEGYDLYASAKRAKDMAEAQVAAFQTVIQQVARILPPASTPRAVVGNLELQSNRDARMARFNELPEVTQKALQRLAIEQILKPIARSEGLPEDVVEGLGSWFEEGSRSITKTGRILFPPGTPVATIRSFMARASMALQQAGYFAAIEAAAPTGIWAVELNLNRALTEAEYSNIIETISVGAQTFNGTTMIALDPARVVIVLNEGVDHAGALQTIERIGDLLPNETIDAETYQVETVANFDADTFSQDVATRGEAAERVDREAAAVHERIAERVALHFATADARAGAEGSSARFVWQLRDVAQQTLTKWLAGFARPGTGRFGLAKGFPELAPAEQRQLLQNVQAALRDENGVDRIAVMVNRLLGGAVQVVPSGTLDPNGNPTNLVSFQNLPADEAKAREWMQRYLAIRGIVLGMDSEASFRLVAPLLGMGDFDGYVVSMGPEQFQALARVLDGGSYDPATGEAVFIDFDGRGAEYTQELVAWLEQQDGDFTVSPASFDGARYGPRDFFTALGRDWRTVQAVAGLLTDFVAPALRASAGSSVADYERVGRVAAGLRDLATQYYAPPIRGQKRVLKLALAERRLAATFPGSLKNRAQALKVRLMTARLNRKFVELLPLMKADLGLTDEQVRDWYRAGTGQQRNILALLQPELANDADWVIATAIHSLLSNGNEVAIETELGAYVYEQWLYTGEISYLDPATAVRGEWGTERAKKSGAVQKVRAKFATGETGTGIGGASIFLSLRWLTHEVGLRRLHKLIATVGKEEAARWLQGSRTYHGRTYYNAIELLGPKVGQYFLDKHDIVNQNSTIDLWIGRLHDILIGAERISGSVTPDKRTTMQEVFRNFLGADNPSAAQAISWYLTKYMYRLVGAGEKRNAYATLPFAAAELLAGRETGAQRQTGWVDVGLPKPHDLITRRPMAGWAHDRKWDTIAKREGWDTSFETNLTLLGLTERELRDMAVDAIARSRAKDLLQRLETLVQGEAMQAYGIGPQSSMTAQYLTEKLYDSTKALGDFAVWGFATPAEVLETIARTTQNRGQLDVLGQVLDTPAAVAAVARPFRDPAYEHAHLWLLDDDGKIVWHSMETIGSPILCLTTRANMLALLRASILTGATRVVASHNHPSGNTKPSEADLRAFEEMVLEFDAAGLELAWSQVIDHDETSFFYRDWQAGATMIAERVPVEADQEEDWTNYTKGQPSITTASEIGALARGSLQPGMAAVFFMDPHQRVLAATQFQLDRFKGGVTQLKWLNELMRNMGSYALQVVVSNRESPGSFIAMSEAMERFMLFYQQEIYDVVNLGPLETVFSGRAAGLLTFHAPMPDPSGSAVSVIQQEDVLRPPQYQPSDDPRVANLSSPDIVTRVVTALSIGTGNLQYSAEQIRQAIIAAKLYPVVGQAPPAGRAAYAAERVMSDVLPVEPQHDKAVKSPEQIVRELLGDIGVPILATGKRWGTLRAPGVTGAYKAFTRIVRLRQRGDIETAVHEVGHRIHELVYGLTATRKLKVKGIPAAHRDELIAMARTGRAVSPKSTDADALREGVAEFFRRFVTNPEAARVQAPQYHDFVVATLERDHPHVLAALYNARRDVQLWRTGTDAARIRARIHSAVEPDAANPNKSVWDKFMEGIVHDLHYIQKLDEQNLPKDAKVRELPHLIAQLMRGHGGAADYWIRFGSADWNTRQKRGPSLEEIIRPIFEAGQRDEFTTYIVARRGLERILAGHDVGFDEATARSVIAKYQSQQFDDAFKKLVTYNRHLLEMLRDAGVISPQDFANIEATGGIDEYVPFHRVINKWQGTRDKNLFLSKKVVRHFAGDTADIIDPLESMIKNTYQFVMAAWQQEVGEALSHLAEQEGTGKLLDRITPGMEQVAEREFGDLWDQVNAQMGGALPGLTKQTRETLVKIFRPGAFFGKRNVISIVRNGQREWFEVTDPDLFKALTGLGREQLHWLTRVASYPSQWRRAGAVLAPEFMIRNPLRDQLSALINSEYGYVPFWDLARGVFHLLTKQDSEMYRRWKLSGGEYSTLVDLDRAGRQRHLIELVRSGKVINNVVHPRQWLATLQAISAVMENGTRLGEFINAYEKEIAKGTDDREAMDRAGLAAREITTDYARHGAITAALRAIATFWNAGLEGDVRVLRAFKHHPVAATAKAFAALTIPSLLLALANSDDDEYWEIPQWERDLFWLVKVPVNWIPGFLQQDEDSGAVGQILKPFVQSEQGVWLRFPKPFGLGQVFGTIPERIVEWLHNNDPEGLKQTLSDLSPTSLSGMPLFGGVFPDVAAIQPMLEAWMNRSRFMERPLVPRAQQGIEATEQYSERTSEFAKFVARSADKAKDLPVLGDILTKLGVNSPAKFENYFRSWTAGLGNYALQLTDLAAKPILRKRDPDVPPGAGRPAKELADIPLVRALAARSPGWQSESIERFYEQYAKLQVVKATGDYHKSGGRLTKALTYKGRHIEDEIQLRYFEQVADKIKELREQSELAMNSEMSPAQKRVVVAENGRFATELAASALNRPYRSQNLERPSATWQ